MGGCWGWGRRGEIFVLRDTSHRTQRAGIKHGRSLLDPISDATSSEEAQPAISAVDCGSARQVPRDDVPSPPMLFLGLHQDEVLGICPGITTYKSIMRIGRGAATSETLTDGWVELLTPPLGTLIVSSTREEVSDFVPLTSVLLYSLDELDVLCVRPTT